MTTTRDIIYRALRKSRVTAIGDTPEAAETDAALDDLNMMMAAWTLAGVDITHTTLALADDFPLDAEYAEGTVYLLSARLNVDYEAPTGFDPDAFLRLLQAAYFSADEAAMPDGLKRMPSQLRTDWTSGT